MGMAVSCPAQNSMVQRQPIVYGYTLRGVPVSHFATAGTEAVVFFYLATDCPISNRYMPEIKKLEAEFAGRRVDFWMVYPNAGETGAGVSRHQTAYGQPINEGDHAGAANNILLRPTATFLAVSSARITPEASVVLASESGGRETLRAVYTGRIDDRYVSFGKERPQATRNDLEQAIEAVLAHRAVPAPGGPPVGCGIIPQSVIDSGAGKP